METAWRNAKQVCAPFCFYSFVGTSLALVGPVSENSLAVFSFLQQSVPHRIRLCQNCENTSDVDFTCTVWTFLFLVSVFLFLKHFVLHLHVWTAQFCSMELPLCCSAPNSSCEFKCEWLFKADLIGASLGKETKWAFLRFAIQSNYFTDLCSFNSFEVEQSEEMGQNYSAHRKW